MDPLLVAQFFCQLLGIQPRDIQSSMMTLQAVFGAGVGGAAGVVVDKEDYKQLQVGYDHFFWQVGGFAQASPDAAPETDTDDLCRVMYNINVKGEGWNNDTWDTPNNLGALLQGGAHPHPLLPGFLHFGEKSQIQIILTPNPLDDVWVGANRVVGIQLDGVKVASDLITGEVRDRLMKRIKAAADVNMDNLSR